MKVLLTTLTCGLLIAAVGLSEEVEMKNTPRVFVSKATHDLYMSYLPDGVFTEDEKRRIVFYDENTTPQVYQQWDVGGMLGVYSIFRNVSADRSEPFGNANREFPWKTGGMDNSDNGHSFKAFILPPGKPITGERRVLPRAISKVHDPHHGSYKTFGTDGREHPAFTGRYPVGSKIVEVLLVDSGNNKRDWKGWYTFEVRVLEKVQDKGLSEIKTNWKPHWFRALKNKDHLWELAKGTKYYDAMLGVTSLNIETLKNHHENTVINVTTVVDDLPRMNADQMRQILQRPFQEVTDVPWLRSQSGYVTYAGSGGPFPRNFRGGHFSSKECMACHATVLTHVNDHQMFRDWYGRVRGFDASISGPALVDETSITNGNGYVEPTWSRKLIQAGMLQVR